MSLSGGDEESEVTTFHLAGHYIAKRSNDSEVFQLATSSPLGAPLVGKTEGEKVSYAAPNGKTFEATIVQIISYTVGLRDYTSATRQSNKSRTDIT